MAYHISVFLHLLSALVWLGGMLSLAILVVPTARYLRSKWGNEVYVEVIAKAGRIFRVVGWTSFLILIITGFLNVHFRYGSILEGFEKSGVVHAKVGIVLLVFILTFLHDVILAPRFEREPARYSKVSSILGRVAFLLSFLAFFLGFALSRGILR